MESRAHALAAGLFVLLLGIGAAYAVWKFGQRGMRPDVYLLTTPGNVIGLNVEAIVRYRGIRAGKVTRIEQDAQDARLLLVRIELDPRFRLTRATTARLGHQGMTGLAYVLLEDPGTSNEILDGQADPPARLPLRPSLIETLGQQAENIGSRAGEVLARLERLLDEDNARNLDRLLENTAHAAAALRQLPATLATLRTALDRLLSTHNLRRIETTLEHLEQTAGQSTLLVQEARGLIAALATLTARLDALAASGDEAVNGELLPRSVALLTELHTSSQRLDRLLATLETAPQALLFGPPPLPPGPGEAGFIVPHPPPPTAHRPSHETPLPPPR